MRVDSLASLVLCEVDVDAVSHELVRPVVVEVVVLEDGPDAVPDKRVQLWRLLTQAQLVQRLVHQCLDPVPEPVDGLVELARPGEAEELVHALSGKLCGRGDLFPEVLASVLVQVLVCDVGLSNRRVVSSSSVGYRGDEGVLELLDFGPGDL